MKAGIILLLIAAPLFGQNTKNISGTITNASGDHVSGVKVCVYSLLCVLSDANGRYKVDNISRHSGAIRFSHPEYNAVINAIKDDSYSEQIDVVLKKLINVGDNKRLIPHCSENDNLVGLTFKVNTFSQNTIKSNGGDYKMVAIISSINKDERLIFMEGFNVSSGIPSWFLMPSMAKSPVIIYDKDIDYENQEKTDSGIPSNSAIDVKARSVDGKFWRFTGAAFQVFYYNNVSEASAREFDDILDTLCVAR